MTLEPGTGPLAGVNVLDLSWIVAGPTVGRAMADYGATVIRVESPSRVDTARVVGPFHRDEPGVENSGLYGNVNAGKWGLTLNLRTPEAQDVFRRLAIWADIVCESFTAGVLERWQLDYWQLRELKPDLIMLSSTLLGQTGPYNQVSGFGGQGAGMSSVQYLTGWPDRPPAGPFGPYTDYPAPRFSLTALLAALDHRRRTGEGVFIDQAQADGTLQLLAPALIDYQNGGPVLERRGNDDPQMVAARRVSLSNRPTAARSRGSRLRSPTTRNGSGSRSSSERTGRLVSTNAASRAPRSTLRSKPGPRSDRLRTSKPRCKRRALRRIGSRRQRMRRTIPQLAHRHHFRRIPHGLHGETVVEGPRYILSETPVEPARPAPQYGEHNELILREVLGMGEVEIAELAASGALS